LNSPFVAEPAVAASDEKRADNTVAFLDQRHARAHLFDDADVLVPDDEPRLDVHAPVVDVQVGTADRAGRHTDDRVARILDDRVGSFDHLDVAHAERCNRLHRPSSSA